MKASVLSISLAALLLIALVPSVLAWEMEKPTITYTFVSEKIDTNYSNGNASVGLGIEIGTYHVNDPKHSYDDYLNLRIVATANTREILTYSFYEDPDYYCWHNLGDQHILPGPYQDDDLIELYLPSIQFQTIRFYGGPRSGEYNLLYVSTNGFVVFGPRAFIAPFWTDLHSDDATKIKAGVVHEGSNDYLCIS